MYRNSHVKIGCCLGVKDMNADHAASHLGKAQGLVNLIRSIPHHASQRQCMAPEDLLLKHNVPQEVLMSSRTLSAGVRSVIFDIASAGKIHLDKVCSSAHFLLELALLFLF